MQIHTQSEQRLAVIFMETPLTAPPGALPSYGMGSLVGSSWDNNSPSAKCSHALS